MKFSIKEHNQFHISAFSGDFFVNFLNLVPLWYRWLNLRFSLLLNHPKNVPNHYGALSTKREDAQDSDLVHKLGDWSQSKNSTLAWQIVINIL